MQDHPAAKNLIKKHSMKIGSGKSFVFKIRMTTGNSFANISITDHDQVNIVDGFVDGQVQWRKSKVNYAFYDEEMSINRSPSRLINLIKTREDGALVDWIEGLENNFWNFPAATNTVTPFGLPYWCTKNATVGFNGGIPTGYTTVAALSPTTWPRWQNYSGNYTNITLDDLVRKARTMAEATWFKPPVSSVPNLETAAAGSQRGYFVNLTTRQSFEDIADSRNDNIGADVAKYDGAVMFRRAPLEYVPILDRDSTNPMYQIDWGVFKIIVQSGWWQKRTVLAPYPGQRNVSAVYLDSLYNIVCYNRRLLGVLATGTTYPA